MRPVKVFVAGSRAVSRLNAALRARLDRIIAEGHEILIGDANGADRAVQQYLSDCRYQKVTVFCTAGKCRNNVGDWQAVAVTPPAGIRGGFEFYAVKDREMAAQATHGLMLWDGASRGTFTNIQNLVHDRKPVVVYLSPEKTFVTVRTSRDVDTLLRQTSGPGGIPIVRRA